MILLTTYNGTDNYIDSDIILYGFDDTGLNLVLNQKAIRYNPNAQIFESNALQAVTVPTYANFVTETLDDNFIEVTHATYTTVCINCARVLRLEDAGGGNTTIYFEVGATLEVTVAIATLQTAINASRGGVSDGDKGDITVSGGGATWSIDNLAVTDAKINDVAAGKVTTDSTKRFVTDAQLTIIGNTSGTNSGDNAANTTSNAYADGKVADAINNGTTTIAPSQNAVFDALALKAPLTSPTFATSINGSYLTASEIVVTDGSKNIVSAPVATYPSLTELAFLKGVTSALQTQLNGKQASGTYLTSANIVETITNGVTTNAPSENAVFDALALKAPLLSPTLITPTLGVAAATSLNTGTTLNGVVFAKSTTDISLASTAHAMTVGGEANSTNLAIGEYSTGLGIQGRNNGAVAATYVNPLGGDVQIGSATVGVQNVIINNTDAGTGSYVEFGIRNGATSADGMLLRTLGTGFTTSGANFQDGGALLTSTNLAGGLSIGTQASADLRMYTNNALRLTMAAATGNISAVGQIVSTGGGLGYATGAGGTVTQITSRTTGVTLNKLCGNITMFSAAQAADALITFTLTNSFIAATDYLQVQHISATNGGAWNISCVCGAGSATINIRNVSNASITEATPLRFFLNKAVTS